MFLRQMRILILTLAVATLFFACSPYQKALKSDDVGLKFHLADSLYNAQEYKKALKLMEQIVPAYRGKPQAEKLMFLYSDTFYNLGDYYLAGYQFERFSNSYPLSEKAEEAAFKGAKSFYHLSPRYSLDQRDTHIALEKLQSYINKFPDSEFHSEANNLVAELTNKLERKEFEVARQYNRIMDYNAAINAFDNFILDHPGSEFRQEAYFMKFKSAYQLAIRSVPHRVEERLRTSKNYYNTFKRFYPESEFSQEANEIFQDIEQRLQNKQV
jgi:outer membrane protein assembly factor BamD